MLRTCLLALLFVLVPFARAAAQEYTKDAFATDFFKGVEMGDERYSDKAMKRGARFAVLYYEDLFRDRGRDPAAIDAKLEALRAAWARCFEGKQTLEKLHRWLEFADADALEKVQRLRVNSVKLWNFYLESIAQQQIKQEYQDAYRQFTELARTAETLGQQNEAAETWVLAGIVANAMPDKTIADRRDAVFATEQFLRARESWEFDHDEHYIRNKQWMENERLKIEEAEKLEQKRADAGYSPDAKGIDSLVVPGKQDSLPLEFAALSSHDAELDYGTKAGPVPPFWWLVSTGENGTNRQMEWFRRVPLYMVRTGATKFGVALDPNDPKAVQEIEATPKAKPTTFWLDAARQQPYAMFFWVGGEREWVGDAECNLAPSAKFGNVYYKSAASWKTTFGKDALTFYDDDSSGTPCNGDPFEPSLKSPMLGDHDGEGTPVPLLDSMRVGKGPRVPFSEFVKLTNGWYHVARGGGEDVVLRPLNPEFVPMGKVKLVWKGPKPTMPQQLVIQGAGDFRTAFFDLAGGKEVEVPAGTYSVIFGRIVSGKGARLQMANLYRGESSTFEVEAGKTFELKMGAPFTIDYTRRGDQKLSIDALKVHVRESSGCVFAELQNMGLELEVMCAKREDGKGAKSVAEFRRFTDPELVNVAANQHNAVGTLVATFPMPEGYREGALELSVELPDEGMKVALTAKKHPVFGALSSDWK